MKLNIFKAAALVLALVIGTSTTLAELHPSLKKDKYGYVNDNGEIVIKHAYQIAMPFVDGIAKVKKGNKWGYINESGKPVIAIVYDDIQPFENGMARITKGGKFGYIRTDGSIVIKPDYNFIGTFNDAGYCWVAKGKSLDIATKGLYKNDKLIIKPVFQGAIGFFVKTDSADYRNGNPLFPNRPDVTSQRLSRLPEPDPSMPYIWMMTSNGWSFIYDLDGKQIGNSYIKGRIGAPHDGIALVMQPGKKKSKFNYYVLGDKPTKLLKKDIEVPNEKLDEKPCYPFINGIAACPSTDGSYHFINTSGKDATAARYDMATPVFGHAYIASVNGKYGILDASANETVAPAYSNIVTPEATDTDEVLAACDDNNMCGYIDLSGNIIIPFEYDNVLSLRHGRAYVKKAGKWGIVDSSNRTIVAPRWNDLIICTHPDDTHTWVKDSDGKWYIHTLANDTRATAKGYTDCTSFDEKKRSIALDDTFAGVIDPTGKVIVPFRFSSMAIAREALARIDAENKETMSEIEAYRMNVNLNPARNKYKLSDTIAEEMWDF